MIKIIERLCSWFVSEPINPPVVKTIYDELGMEDVINKSDIEYDKVIDSLRNDSSF